MNKSVEAIASLMKTFSSFLNLKSPPLLALSNPCPHINPRFPWLSLWFASLYINVNHSSHLGMRQICIPANLCGVVCVCVRCVRAYVIWFGNDGGANVIYKLVDSRFLHFCNFSVLL